MADARRLAGDPPSPWEGEYGFSRVVAAGGFVIVGGTTSATPDGCVLGEAPYEQAAEALRRIGDELSRAGAAVTDVVQLRAYVTDISRSADVGRAVAEAYGEIRPLLTMVEVSGLIDPRMLVEIEAVAVVDTPSSR